MIQVDAILKTVRFKQADNNEVKFSDYDILQSINEALRFINQSYSLKNSDFLEKVVEYTLDERNKEINAYNLQNPKSPKELYTYEDGFPLPDDYLSLVSITTKKTHYPLHPCNALKIPNHREYKIVANTLYTKEDVLFMYRFSLSAPGKDGTIDLPEIFYDIIVKLTGLILNNAETDVMREAVDSLVNELVPARRYTNRIVHPIWKV